MRPVWSILQTSVRNSNSPKVKISLSPPKPTIAFAKEKADKDMDREELNFKKIYKEIEHKCYYIDAYV